MHSKRWAAGLLLCLLLAGCNRFFEGEYTSITKQEDTTELVTSGKHYEVRTYAGLKNAVQLLISTAAETGTIRAVDYSGSVQDDVARACLEITRDDPLGAYAVEYISHSVGRILGYYEVEIHISYRLTPEDISAVRSAATVADLYSMIEDALARENEHLTVQIASLSVTGNSIENYVESSYRRHPERLAAQPDAAVVFYPSEDAVNKIVDLRFSYQSLQPGSGERLRELNRVSAELTDPLAELPQEEKALLCCISVAQTVGAPGRGSTAYDALVLKTASSEGCAMAYQLLCNRCGVECQVVEGRCDGAQRYWNIVRLNRSYYHVDTFAGVADSPAVGFLLSDAEMNGRYWWDVDRYPACRGILNAQQVAEAYFARQNQRGFDEPAL